MDSQSPGHLHLRVTAGSIRRQIRQVAGSNFYKWLRGLRAHWFSLLRSLKSRYFTSAFALYTVTIPFSVLIMRWSVPLLGCNDGLYSEKNRKMRINGDWERARKRRIWKGQWSHKPRVTCGLIEDNTGILYVPSPNGRPRLQRKSQSQARFASFRIPTIF